MRGHSDVALDKESQIHFVVAFTHSAIASEKLPLSETGYRASGLQVASKPVNRHSHPRVTDRP